MGIEWYSASLRGVETLKTALEAVATVSSTMSTAAGAVSTALNLLPSIADASALAANAAVNLLVTQLTGAITDVLATGIYVLPVYPSRVDWNAAKLAEIETDAAKAVEAAKGALDLARQDSRRAKDLPRLSNAYDAAVKAHAQAKRDKLFSGAGPLATTFDFNAFVSTIEASLQDAADVSRPRFTTSSVTAGVVVMYSVDSLVELTNAMLGLAVWMNNPGLSREAGMLSRLTSLAVTPLPEYSTPPEPPDWWSVSVGQALGVQDQIDILRRAASSIGVSSFTSGSPTIAAVLTYLDDLARAFAEAGDAVALILAALSAIGALNASARVLVIPPFDGEKVVDFAGTPVTMPNYTAGTDGFLAALRGAENQPTSLWNVGLVFMGGFPCGIDLLETPSSLAALGPAREAAGQAQAFVDLLRGVLPAA